MSISVVISFNLYLEMASTLILILLDQNYPRLLSFESMLFSYKHNVYKHTEAQISKKLSIL